MSLWQVLWEKTCVCMFWWRLRTVDLTRCLMEMKGHSTECIPQPRANQPQHTNPNPDSASSIKCRSSYCIHLVPNAFHLETFMKTCPEPISYPVNIQQLTMLENFLGGENNNLQCYYHIVTAPYQQCCNIDAVIQLQYHPDDTETQLLIQSVTESSRRQS